MEIGGYFNTEEYDGQPYHGGIAVNTGRNAIELAIRMRGHKKVWLPFYSCTSMIQPMQRMGLPYSFYHIDEDFLPILTAEEAEDACVIIINYFGLLTDVLPRLVKRYCCTIVDNTQAFFVYPLPGVDTVYSCRKFFGVPDGGYLCTNGSAHLGQQDVSYLRTFPNMRFELGAAAGYGAFRENEQFLDNQPAKRMSKLTQNTMRSLAYSKIMHRRQANFSFLHHRLGKKNILSPSLQGHIAGPFCYPFIGEPGLRDFLISQKIYVATYWQEVLARVESTDIEAYYTQKLIPLPVDHRYGESEMAHIADVISRYL